MATALTPFTEVGVSKISNNDLRQRRRDRRKDKKERRRDRRRR